MGQTMGKFQGRTAVRLLILCTMYLVCAVWFLGCQHEQAIALQQPAQAGANQPDNATNRTQEQTGTETTPQSSNAPDKPSWVGEPTALFDGKSLEGWEVIEFGGEGECAVENGLLSLEAGDPMTGLALEDAKLPKSNYEVSLDARKTDGIDFFCGLTFPVAESHCTLIVGGWGGSTVGLSCIDDKDASSNDTTSLRRFKKNQWYKIRVRVQSDNISAWIDDEQVVDQNTTGKKISLRGDTQLCKPLGICSFMTMADYKNIQIRRFNPVQPAQSPDQTKQQQDNATKATNKK